MTLKERDIRRELHDEANCVECRLPIFNHSHCYVARERLPDRHKERVKADGHLKIHTSCARRIGALIVFLLLQGCAPYPTDPPLHEETRHGEHLYRGTADSRGAAEGRGRGGGR